MQWPLVAFPFTMSGISLGILVPSLLLAQDVAPQISCFTMHAQTEPARSSSVSGDSRRPNRRFRVCAVGGTAAERRSRAGEGK